MGYLLEIPEEIAILMSQIESLEMTSSRQKPKLGDVVKIDIGGGHSCYGRVLNSPLMAFYDIRSEDEISTDQVVLQPVLFKICVYHHAVKSGRWEIIGNKALEDELKEPAIFFREDILSGKLYKHYQDGREFLSNRNECMELERAAVWEPEHVEDRLRDHFDGVPNKWLESLKLK